MKYFLCVLLCSIARQTAHSQVVTVFSHTSLHFSPDSSGKFLNQGETALDNGRVIEKSVTLPTMIEPTRIIAKLWLHPVPVDERTVADRYDRAGSIRLAVENMPELEVLRFMTSYGGETTHEMDVTQLAPLLTGLKTFRAFVDTWSSPGWELDFSLEYTPDSTAQMPDFVLPVYYTDSFNREQMPKGISTSVTIPDSFAYSVLYYTTTGHCTDGRDEDEFISKANVISVDDVVVERFHPWRVDCRKLRELNPYCARWTDGSWSSDYSRSGWCPGDIVTPHEIDATDHLARGERDISIQIENMRPKNAEGHFGYWRVSAYVVGWKSEPKLWMNY